MGAQEGDILGVVNSWEPNRRDKALTEIFNLEMEVSWAP